MSDSRGQYRDLLTTKKNRIRLYGAHNSGAEATQAIQYSRPENCLTDQELDNGVKDLAGKLTYGDIYGSLVLLARQDAGFPGKLEVLGAQGGLFYQSVAPHTRLSPGILTACQDPSYNDKHSNSNTTFPASNNFLIPAQELRANGEPVDAMCGTLKLRAIITVSDGLSDLIAVNLDETPQQSLSIRWIMRACREPACNDNSYFTGPIRRRQFLRHGVDSIKIAICRTTIAVMLLTFIVVVDLPSIVFMSVKGMIKFFA